MVNHTMTAGSTSYGYMANLSMTAWPTSPWLHGQLHHDCMVNLTITVWVTTLWVYSQLAMTVLSNSPLLYGHPHIACMVNLLWLHDQPHHDCVAVPSWLNHKFLLITTRDQHVDWRISVRVCGSAGGNVWRIELTLETAIPHLFRHINS